MVKTIQRNILCVMVFVIVCVSKVKKTLKYGQSAFSETQHAGI